MHQRKKPPPQMASSSLRWGARLLTAWAGQFTQSRYSQFEVTKEQFWTFYANQTWLALARAGLSWRFYLAQYRSGDWFCQADRGLGMLMVATNSKR
ncbi:hypothetical protein QUF63_16860 [Anaerolineales bacterium HSG25]|nr:hypothetical protein [Anaerolineales bacterium HSG25]